MKALNILDIGVIVKELQELVGGKIDKIYQPDGFLIKVHKPNVGKIMIKIEPNKLWITEKKQEMPVKVSGFCAKLRKEFEGRKITKIEQAKGERIVKFTIESKDEKKHLIIELFANGNLILTNSHDIIIIALEERSWKDREIKKGLEYKLPPSQKHPTLKPTKLTFKTLSEEIDSGIDVTKPKKTKTAYDNKKAKLQKMIKAQEKSIQENNKVSALLQTKGDLIYENYQEMKKIIDSLKEAQKTYSLQELKKKVKHEKIKAIHPEKQTIVIEVK